MTSTQAWELISKLKWTQDHNSMRVSIQVFTTLGPQERKELLHFIETRFAELDKLLSPLDLGHGDDSYGDLIYHIIGSGLTCYSSVVTDPKLARTIKPVEGFSYIFQREEHDFQPTHYIQRILDAASRFVPIADRAFRRSVNNCLRAALTCILHPDPDMGSLRDLLPLAQSLAKHAANTQLWLLPNILSDLIRFRPYFPEPALVTIRQHSADYMSQFSLACESTTLDADTKLITNLKKELGQAILTDKAPPGYDLSTLLQVGFRGLDQFTHDELLALKRQLRACAT
jgi:hypothetical protein